MACISIRSEYHINNCCNILYFFIGSQPLLTNYTLRGRFLYNRHLPQRLLFRNSHNEYIENVKHCDPCIKRLLHMKSLKGITLKGISRSSKSADQGPQHQICTSLFFNLSFLMSYDLQFNFFKLYIYIYKHIQFLKTFRKFKKSYIKHSFMQ